MADLTDRLKDSENHFLFLNLNQIDSLTFDSNNDIHNSIFMIYDLLEIGNQGVNSIKFPISKQSFGFVIVIASKREQEVICAKRVSTS